jgi:DNA-binding MurR/RpiR family transcriptional regulator
MNPVPISPTPIPLILDSRVEWNGYSTAALPAIGRLCQGTRMDQPLTAPDTLEALFQLLAERAETLPKRLRQCADYIARNPDRVAVSTVAELAAAADVQPSAIMRFCQDLGFSGFTQMQRLFRDEYSRKWPDYSTRLQNLRATGESRPEVLLAEFVEAGRTSLERLMSTVDPGLLARAVDLLADAPLIHLVGYRRSFPVASYMAYALEKMAIPCVLHAAVGHLPTAHAVRPRDAVIAITFAPYSPETLAFVEAARAADHPVVAITDSLSSPLQRLNVLPLLVSEVDVGAFRALSATFALAISLAVALGARRGAEIAAG